MINKENPSAKAGQAPSDHLPIAISADYRAAELAA